MGISLPNIIIILCIVLILFGAGKLPKVMGDIGKGIKNFKDGLKDEDNKEEDKPLLKNDKQDHNK
jgi:sec-independent protein translocase protein TatA